MNMGSIHDMPNITFRKQIKQNVVPSTISIDLGFDAYVNYHLLCLVTTSFAHPCILISFMDIPSALLESKAQTWQKAWLLPMPALPLTKCFGGSEKVSAFDCENYERD